MARPLSVTDDNVISAASAVVNRVGFDGFTISEVAREVGLTRAAITQRFGDAGKLKTLVRLEKAERFEHMLAELRAAPGPDGILEIAAFLGNLVGSRTNLSLFMQEYSASIDDKVRMEVEHRRGLAMRNAIIRVMPPCNVEPDIAAELFQSFMSGSMLSWQATRSGDAQCFLRERARQWMQMMGLLPVVDILPDRAR